MSTAPTALLLASRSPQRRAILEQLGVPFSAIATGADELEAGDPVEVARENARRKALAVPAEAAEGATVLAVDTLVALDGVIYGKPHDASHAAATLSALSGRTHAVISGLALRRGEELTLVDATTQVTFREVGEIVQWYVATEEWRDRAGGYAIQGRGAALVAGIDGDYLNVVGLPVAALIDAWPGILELAR